jgi:UTP:GlnB (protein PII) uridylyltransferase
MSVEELCKRLGRSWPAITKAETEADRQVERIRTLLKDAAAVGGSVDSADITVVAFGSLARREWTSGSDLDWTLLIDGQADQGHAETGRRMATILTEGGFTPPGQTGSLATSPSATA